MPTCLGDVQAHTQKSTWLSKIWHANTQAHKTSAVIKCIEGDVFIILVAAKGFAAEEFEKVEPSQACNTTTCTALYKIWLSGDVALTYGSQKSKADKF